MRFTSAIVAALSAAVSQAVIITNSDFSGIAVGKPFVITFAEAVGQVTVYLGTGTPTNLIQGPALGSAAGPSGSVSWTPTSGGSFALKIVDAGAPEGPTNPNFSGFFTVSGAVASTTTALTSTTTGATVSTSSTTGTQSTSMRTSSTTTSMTTSAVKPPTNSTTTMMTSTTSARTNTTMTGATTATTGGNTVPTQVPSSLAANFASPLAFVLLAFGALLTLN